MTSLDAIKARAEAATEGPWSWSGHVAPVLSGYAGTSYRYSKEVIEAEHHGECGCRSLCQLELTVEEADAEFITAARSDVPALVAALEAVLELHEPEATGYGDWVCGACISAGSHDWESTAYPCPTVTAIQSALGEGQ